MAFLSTTKIGENYGLTAKPYIFDYLLKENFIRKPYKKYELTLKGQQYGKVFTSSQGEQWIVWDEEKFSEILNILKLRILKDSKINFKLYHMTHFNNLKSIITNGFLSHNKMLSLSYIDISNQEVNNRRAHREPYFNHFIHDYVPFYYNVRNAMLYSTQQRFGQDVIIIEVDVNACFQKQTLFTDINAATEDAMFYNCLKEFLDKADWATINSWSWFEKELIVKQRMMSECLIFDRVNSRFIKNIYTQNQFMGKKVCDCLNELNFDIESVYFGEQHFFKNLMR